MELVKLLSIIIFPSLPSTIIEFAIPNPIAKWIFPPGVSYDNIFCSNSSECKIKSSTSDVIGMFISLSLGFEHPNKIIKEKNNE